MTLNPEGNNTLQSIRSSCDRCRFYKLKCIVPTAESDNPVLCQRCTRAKVPCVFGRRRRATRLSDAKKRPGSATWPGPPNSASTAAPLCEKDMMEVEMGLEVRKTVAAAPDMMPGSRGLSMECELEAAAHAAAFDVHPWESENLTLGLADNGPDHQQQQQSSMSGSISDWDWDWDKPQQQHNNNFNLDDDIYILDTDGLLDPMCTSWPPSPSPVVPLPTPNQQLTQSNDIKTPSTSDSTCNGSNSNNTESSSSNLGQRLVALIADMQQCLKMLEEGPWQHDSARSLDDYPVGNVLHLSQQFGSLAGPVLSRGCGATAGMRAVKGAGAVTGSTGSTTSGSRERGREAQPANNVCKRNYSVSSSEEGAARGSGSGSESSPGVDTVTTLLVLGGYVLFVRIYSIVLGHFQTHLSRIPSNSDCETYTTTYTSNITSSISSTIQSKNVANNNMNTNNTTTNNNSNIRKTASTDTGTGIGTGIGINTPTTTSPTLQLGQLPYAAPVLGRIHTAICMLLSALHNVEEQLGQRGAVARNLIVALLTQEENMLGGSMVVGELQDNYGELNRKIGLIKEVLQEKMFT